MMKKVSAILLILALVLVIAPGAFAAAPKVVDDAGLLSDSQRESLEQKAEELAETYGIDVVIYTVYSMDGQDPEGYADDYYDENGYGIGEDHSGILFLLSMEYRDWAISTCGDGIYALTDYGIESVFSDMAGELSDGNYYDAFCIYLSSLEGYLKAFQNGSPVDGFTTEYVGPGSYEGGTAEEVIHYGEDRSSWTDYLIRFLIALGIGAAAGGITLAGLKKSMNTAVPQRGAQSYLKGNVNITSHMDILVGSHTSRTPRSTGSSGGSGRSGGGSSVHHSSGGVRHGGGHGKF